MNSQDIQNNIRVVFDDFLKEEFVYHFLLAYGISKTSVTRLKKGDFNLSQNHKEVLYKNKIFFKTEETDKLLSTIDAISKDQSILRHKPRFAIVIDYKYQQLVAQDLKSGATLDIKLYELPSHFEFFLPLAGSEVYSAPNDNEADRNAAYKMAELYDLLREKNPKIYDSKQHTHHLNIFLSRLLFCYFSEDTGIFKEESIFTNTLVQHTQDDGSDTHDFLHKLFAKLNTEKTQDSSDYLENFPYVNGDLFKDKIEIPIFSSRARKVLIELGDLDWKNINPDIFGSMIQAVVIDTDRSNLGMHYTSVTNILKLIKPLFLDELDEVFEKAKDSEKQLQKLIVRLSTIKFFDPACGSGNFLIITYKEIRVLEIKILQRIIELTQANLFVESTISLSQFYGIEIDDFAHEIAILSLWLAEHQMNQYFEEQLAGYTEEKSIIPLKKSGTIEQGNATRLDWKEVCPITKDDEVYIVGNPPYLGTRNQNKEQKNDLELVFKDKFGNLDYISAWFYKGAKYISGLNARCAFVSTNSIFQGEQVSLIWTRVLNEQIEIDFAHQSFKWINNAKGNAGVTVVIVGLRNTSKKPKYLFKDSLKKKVKNINGYLLNSGNIFVKRTSYPISKLTEIKYGNMPLGCSYLILNKEEKDKLTTDFPESEIFIKKLLGASEYIRGIDRFCLWIDDNQLEYANIILPIKDRIQKTKEYRLKSKEKTMFNLSLRPHQFRDRSTAIKDQIIIPTVSSEKRKYIPIGFLNKDTIISNSAQVIYDAEPWIFAVVTSRMHMVWVRAVGGKLETRYRYSSTLCYNTFPFPDIDPKQKESLRLYVFAILDERAKHAGKTMAWMYNPDTMPEGLKLAHQDLDKAIERCYRLQPFKNDTERLGYLFKQYEEIINKNSIFAKQKKTRQKKVK
ncbi:FIG045374: Type II restriction enzyme, methylase subunit YeeA [uncultured Candidatus Thioglobus sp.]|nr:FIG045374: Type II restriction enzyme, methylase subunit YeeA [uncultured Candidatus Thioglobus sp.]